MSAPASSSSVSPRTDTLSMKYPPGFEVSNTSLGPMSIPFHIYSAKSSIIFMDVDPKKVESFLVDSNQHKEFSPILTETGRAVSIIYLVDYQDSTAGKYLEAMIAFICRMNVDENVAPISANPMLWYPRIFGDPQCRMVNMKLWLDQIEPIVYGRDILGADKLHGDMTMQLSPAKGVQSCSIVDKTSGEMVLKYSLSAYPEDDMHRAIESGMTTSMKALANPEGIIVSHFDVYFTKGVLPKDRYSSDIVPRTPLIQHNYLHDLPVMQLWTDKDQLEMGPALRLNEFDVKPYFVLRTNDCRAVCLPPMNVALGMKSAHTN